MRSDGFLTNAKLNVMYQKLSILLIIKTALQHIDLILKTQWIFTPLFIHKCIFCVFNKQFVCFHFLAWFKLTLKWPWTPLFTWPSTFPPRSVLRWSESCPPWTPLRHHRVPFTHNHLGGMLLETGTRGANMAMLCDNIVGCDSESMRYYRDTRVSTYECTSMRTFRNT